MASADGAVSAIITSLVVCVVVKEDTGATDSLLGEEVLVDVDDVVLCDDIAVTVVSGVVVSTAVVVFVLVVVVVGVVGAAMK